MRARKLAGVPLRNERIMWISGFQCAGGIACSGTSSTIQRPQSDDREQQLEPVVELGQELRATGDQRSEQERRADLAVREDRAASFRAGRG